MVTVINFADNEFRSRQKFNTRSAKIFGRADRVIEYGPKDIDKSFLEQSKDLLVYSKGFGNYFWKPYILHKAFDEIKDGQYMFYADSGSFFIKSIKPLIAYLESKHEDILCFQIPLIEKEWTKRDAFQLMNCDSEKYANSPQVMGGFLLLKKTENSVEFLSEFLRFSMDKRILSDDPNVMGKDNYPGFKAHRHDQSILSLLSKKNNILTVGDPSDYGQLPHRYYFKREVQYDKKLSKPKNHIFRGTLICHRKQNQIRYFLKYLVLLTFAKLGYKI